jgi:hypothetical protein
VRLGEGRHQVGLCENRALRLIVEPVAGPLEGNAAIGTLQFLKRIASQDTGIDPDDVFEFNLRAWILGLGAKAANTPPGEFQGAQVVSGQRCAVGPSYLAADLDRMSISCALMPRKSAASLRPCCGAAGNRTLFSIRQYAA